MRNWTRGLVAIVAMACVLGMAYGCVSLARDASSDAVAESPEGMSDSSKVVEFEGGQGQAQPLPQGDLGSSYAGPTVPDEWLSYPSQFDSEDDRHRYEAGEWHTDADLRNRYSFATVRTSSGAEYVAGELVVVFPSHATEDQIERQAASLGCVAAEIHDPATNGDRRVRLVFPDNADMEAVAENVSAQLGLDASLDAVFRVMEGDAGSERLVAGSDTYRSKQLYLAKSKFYSAWSTIQCNSAVAVAVLDTGIDMDHPDLIDNIDTSNAYDAMRERRLGSAANLNGHGTIVSGVISGVMGNDRGISGASANAVIIPIKVLDDTGQGDLDDLLTGIEYATSLGDAVDVINMSLSSGTYANYLQAAVNYASVTWGITCVAAAGNDSMYGSTGQSDPSAYPAACDNVIAVGSVDYNESWSSFSRVGSFVDICAYGEAVFSTTDPGARLGRGNYYDDRYNYSSTVVENLSGTSFAASQVAAAAALLKAQNPVWTPWQIEERLKETAVDLGPTGRDDWYGDGLLDAGAAVGVIGFAPDTGTSVYGDWAALAGGRS